MCVSRALSYKTAKPNDRHCNLGVCDGCYRRGVSLMYIYERMDWRRREINCFAANENSRILVFFFIYLEETSVPRCIGDLFTAHVYWLSVCMRPGPRGRSRRFWTKGRFILPFRCEPTPSVGRRRCKEGRTQNGV